MFPFTLLVVYSLLSDVLAATPPSSVHRISSSRFLPKTFIVEFDTVADIPGRRALNTVHDAFYSRLAESATAGFKTLHEYKDPDIFVGASIKFFGDQDLSSLSKLPGVKDIRPVVLLPRPINIDKKPPPNRSVSEDPESTHIMTGVDKLHARGLQGQGIKIGIIDTGTDYTHPALGGGFGSGKKVAGGYDFVGDNYNGTNAPVPDPDPLDQCAGHGTHVAGIIGANPDNDFNVSGVAYRSTLYSYRVFGCEGTSRDDIMIAALLRGASDGMDILTLSLGGADGWTEGMGSVVASRLANQGKVVTIAAGNNGAFGSWYASGPGNGIDVISVASVDNSVIPIQNATTSDTSHPTIPYLSGAPLPVTGSLPLYATSNDTTVADDACEPLPANTPDLSKFLVIIRRGTCSLVTKLKNIVAKGAKVSLIYNNGRGYVDIDTGNFTSALISADDGKFLVSKFATGATIAVAFPQIGHQYNLRNPTGGLISEFSSYGPTYDLFFKPAVAAPGGKILSTFPVPLGSWRVLSGTSMATPFVAGSAALLLQAKGNGMSKSVRTIFETTAQKVPSSKTDGDPLQTLTVQGAGLINVLSAVDYKTSVYPGELILNDTAHFVGTHQITVYNAGSQPQTYKLSHVPAGTAVTIKPGTIFPSDGPVPLTTDFATVKFNTDTLYVPPFGRTEFTVTFTPPENVDKTTFPVYTGFIQIESQTETLHVAYQGVAAAMKDMKIIDDTDAFLGIPLPTMLNRSLDPQTNATNYTFVDGDFPTLLYRLASGTARLAIDLVPADAKLGKREVPSPSDWTLMTETNDGGNQDSYQGVPILGPLGLLTFQPRNPNTTDNTSRPISQLQLSKATFANANKILNGMYRVLMRALKITGDPKNENDYETYLSPIIGVQKN